MFSKVYKISTFFGFYKFFSFHFTVHQSHFFVNSDLQ